MDHLTFRVEVPGLPQVVIAKVHTFKTGSTGYYASGKIALPNGQRLQVGINAVVIGSNPNPKTPKGAAKVMAAL